MELPEDDEQYLKEKGFDYELLPDGQGALLVIKNFGVDATRYDRDTTNLMIRIPDQYQNAKLDMFYADPPIKLKSGVYPDKADHFEKHGGRQWQRFSRHLDQWRVGVDGVPTMLSFARRELQNGS